MRVLVAFFGLRPRFCERKRSGTTLKANASKNRNVRYDRAGELVERLELEVRELMEQAERTERGETDTS